MCLKLSIYYNLVGDTLIDRAGGSGLVNTYKDYGCTKYLAPRPQKFESDNSKQANEFCVSLSTYSRPMMVSLMQSAIDYDVENIWFPDLIDQLGNFDEVEIGSDNDLADAYGIALMQAVSNNVAPRDNTQTAKEDPFSLGGWTFDKNGEHIPIDEENNQYFGTQKDFDGFGL